MTLFKDETTARLDAANLAAAEAVELYRDFTENVEDAALRPLLAEHTALQANLLEQLEALRRARGELPQAGDPERSHLGFAGAYLRAQVLPGDATAHYAESLLDTATRVAEQLDEALALKLDAELERTLRALKQTNAALVAALQDLARDAS